MVQNLAELEKGSLNPLTVRGGGSGRDPEAVGPAGLCRVLSVGAAGALPW